MKIEYKDGSYLEINKVNEKINISISATDAVNKRKLVVNSAIINMDDWKKIISSLGES